MIKDKLITVKSDERIEQQINWLLGLMNEDLGSPYYESRSHLIRCSLNHLVKKHKKLIEKKVIV